MGMGIGYKIRNGNVKEWKLTAWEWEGIGMQKAIPGHLYVRWFSFRMQFRIACSGWMFDLKFFFLGGYVLSDQEVYLPNGI